MAGKTLTPDRADSLPCHLPGRRK